MSRRGLLIALIVSLAVNLFVLGGVVGAILMGFVRPPVGPPQAGPARLAAVGAVLAPTHRELWETTVRQTAQSTGSKLHQARELRHQAWAALANDPVNPQPALAALEQARTLEFQARSEMDGAVVGFAVTLPADERRKLGEALIHARQHPPHGPWSGGRPAPGGGEPRPPDR